MAGDRRRLRVFALTALACLAGASPAMAQGGTGGSDTRLPAAEPGELTAPLDHAGEVPGALQIKWVRYRATSGQARGTIVFLTGGPGEPAIAQAASIARNLQPLLADHDLVIPDQRGVGESSPLRCATAPRGLFGPRSQRSAEAQAAAVAKCGDELGRSREHFSTYATTLDLELIRQRLGVEKIIPLGVSYGGQVAGEYARRYPERTQAVVMDSTSPIEGIDTLGRLPGLALNRVIREVCFPPKCETSFGAPEALLGRALRRLARSNGLRAQVVLPSGAKRTGRVGPGDLYALVSASDVDPLLRSELPAAADAAARGDGAPLLRLAVRQFGGTAEGPVDDGPTEITRTQNDVRYLTTACGEGRLPWDPAGDLAARPGQLAAALAEAPEAYAPFPAEAVAPNLIASLCLAWPQTKRPPFVPNPTRAPDVPALVIAGREDLRTPLEDQRRAAGQFPNGQVLAVPGIGHSVLATDVSGCALRGLQAFLSGQPKPVCDRTERPVSAAPPLPASLSRLPVTRGLPARVGRTAQAIALTILDMQRQAEALSAGGATLSDVENRELRFGGLRGGRAELDGDGVELRNYEVVPGVRLTGALNDDLAGRLTITGTGAVGRVTLTSAGFRGVLDGRAITFRIG